MMSTFEYEAPSKGGDGADPKETTYCTLSTDPDQADFEEPVKEDYSDGSLLEDFPSRPDLDGDVGGHCDGRNLEEYEDDILRPGDHVYIWRKFGILRKSHQKHGIVYSVDPDDQQNVTVVTFYHRDGRDREGSDPPSDYNREEWNDESLLHQGATSKRKKQKITASVRTESLFTFSDNEDVHKVKYSQSHKTRLLSRGGTVTSCNADERGLIIARIKYLLENPHMLPEHQMLSANGECAAVWCRMGQWCTLQGSTILHILFVGHAGGAVAGGLVASNIFFWAPMPGMWGSVGYIWYVPATVAFPILVPILIGFGLVSLVPLEILRRFRKKWAQISRDLNADFWAKTDDDVKELYFSSSLSTDDEWAKKFFMFDANVEKEKGKYMPLNSEVDDDGPHEEDEDEIMKRISTEYGMNPSVKQEAKNNPSSLKENWQTMVGMLNTSFANRGKHNVTANVEEKHDSKNALLADEAKRDTKLPHNDEDLMDFNEK